jgi:hypothetical protein
VTVGMIIGLVLLPFAWMLMGAANKGHREETGVNMPSRSALKGLRRRARQRAISENEAYAEWLMRKQKKLYSPPRPPRAKSRA